MKIWEMFSLEISTHRKHVRAVFKNWREDFPGGSVVKNLPANAGDMGSSPGLGRSPHAVEQLSPGTTTTEPVL